MILQNENFKTNIGKSIKEGFIKIDKKYKEKLEDDGTTAVVAFITKEKVIVGNAGDSRCIYSNHEGTAVPLSFDHKPNDENEKKRILNANFEISKDTIVQHGKRTQVYRINGEISVSRTIGKKKKKIVLFFCNILFYYFNLYFLKILFFFYNHFYKHFL